MRHFGVNEAEYADFYVAHRDRCLRAVLASGLPRQEADDALAEAFARAWASWPKVRRLDAPAAWVVRTAVNANISWWRKRRREVITDEPAPAPRASTAGLDPDLVAALGRLTPRQREVVVLRYLLDLDTRATATWLGVSEGTVKAQLHHGLRAVRHQLGLPEGAHR